jgi:NADH-quinone oxidoreductase subunit N
MPLLSAPDFMPALPEIFLGAAAMALLMLGVHQGERASREIAWLSVGALAIALFLVLAPLAEHGPARAVSLFGMFVTDGFGAYAKVLVILGSALTLIIALAYNDRHGIARPEYPVLMLFATAGMMMMISANDLISLYLALELQNLALYVLASFARDSDLSTEAGLKYFVLGALASGMLLYGASMVYGFAGTTNFDALAHQLAGGAASVGLVVGIVFIAVGLAFKCSAAPFHMWTPDVYQGAPTPVTAFLSVAPKTAALMLFARVMVGPFGGLIAEWRQVIWFIAVASMLLGSFAAINQRSIKRLMAYSSIGHVGYALVGLAAGTPAGIRGILVYMAIYLFMNVGVFAVILCMKRDGRMIDAMDDLAGLSRTQPALAAALAIFMFSMAGVPPFAGFFAKIYVFLAAIDAGLYVLAVIGMLTSVVGAYYYLRIVKIMYFDEPVSAGYDKPIGREMQAVLLVSAVAVLLFFIYPGAVVDGADQVAAALFAG